MNFISPFLFVSLVSLISAAEYRVFKLQIANRKTNNVRQIQSTLDPEQYRTIFPTDSQETVTYVQTWRCKGRTDHFKAYCQSPELKP